MNENNFAFAFMLNLARVIDDPDSAMILYYKGNQVLWLQPQTSEYWTMRDILKNYRWEDYPTGYGNCCVMWIDSHCAVQFDEFDIWYN